MSPKTVAKPGAAAAKKPAAKKPVKRKPQDPNKQWANYLRRYRPGLTPFVLDALEERYGRQEWHRTMRSEGVV